MSGNAQRRASSGFSLLEILLVVVIIGMASIVMAVGFQKGLQHARLREAGNIVKASVIRARNLAIIQQTHTQVRYDTEAGTVEILGLNDRGQRSEFAQLALGIDLGSQDTLMYDDSETAQEREVRLASSAAKTIAKQKMPVGIELTDFSSESDVFEDGVYRVDFWPTGYAQGHVVHVEDPERLDQGDEKARLKIEVENITGEVSVSEERW